jgi:hypothetical protein
MEEVGGGHRESKPHSVNPRERVHDITLILVTINPRFTAQVRQFLRGLAVHRTHSLRSRTGTFLGVSVGQLPNHSALRSHASRAHTLTSLCSLRVISTVLLFAHLAAAFRAFRSAFVVAWKPVLIEWTVLVAPQFKHLNSYNLLDGSRLNSVLDDRHISHWTYSEMYLRNNDSTCLAV